MSITKSLAKRAAPNVFFALKARYRNYHFRAGHCGSEHRAKRALVRRYGQQILAGPFREMWYGDDDAREQELHAVIGDIVGRGYSTVVDVGCAEGYYAVGLALRLPAARVYAFDTDPDAQRYCRATAEMNEVEDRVTIAGFCGHTTLQPLCGQDTIVFCDCEGFEFDLLDPRFVPGLAHTDVFVELHDFIRPNLTGQLLARFEATHAVRLIDTSD